jgi:Ankyrin repeats (many copies)
MELSDNFIQIDVLVPPELCCPRSGKLFNNPYVVLGGNTYEYEMLSVSEFDRCIPNFLVKSMVEKFISENPSVKTKRYNSLCKWNNLIKILNYMQQNRPWFGMGSDFLVESVDCSFCTDYVDKYNNMAKIFNSMNVEDLVYILRKIEHVNPFKYRVVFGGTLKSLGDFVIAYCNVDVVKFFIKYYRIDLNYISDGWSLIQIACSYQNWNVVKYFVEKGVDKCLVICVFRKNQYTGWKTFPLLTACGKPTVTIETVKLLSNGILNEKSLVPLNDYLEKCISYVTEYNMNEEQKELIVAYLKTLITQNTLSTH